MGVASFTARGRLGQETGCEGTSWQSDTCVACRTARGGMGCRRVQVTAGVRDASMSAALSAEPIATSVVCARSAAEMPVETPSRASIDTVNAVAFGAAVVGKDVPDAVFAVLFERIGW